jgi:transcription antitermination factor NusG
MKWWAAYTQPNKERTTVEKLHGWGYDVFYPFYRNWVRTSQRGRSRLVSNPFFPRYFFVQCTEVELPAVKDCDFVTYIVGSGGVPVSIDSRIIDRLRRLATPTGEILQGKEKKKRYKSGDIVRVTDEDSPLFNFLLTVASADGIITTIDSKSGLKIKVSPETIELAQK